MPRLTIIHSCGHDQDHQLTGAGPALAGKQRQLAKQACSRCLKRAERKAAAALVAGLDLPPLRGSESQVRWATDIRAEFAAKLLAMAGGAAARAQIVANLSRELTAHWWIEHRNAYRQAYRDLSHRQR